MLLRSKGDLGRMGRTQPLDQLQLAELTVLAVDDNANTLRLVREILRAGGVGRVDTVPLAVDALKTLSALKPDLIFVDWNMPRMNGLAMTKIIRAAAVRPDPMIPNPAVPIIMVTSQRREIDVERARLAGVTEFIVKPFAPTLLMSRLQAALTRARPFVTTQRYVGPDRRRRAGERYGGLRRRSDEPPDPRIVMREELRSIRDHAAAHGGGDDETRRLCYQSMQKNLERARSIRDTAIEQASKSLLRYVDTVGGPEAADPGVVEVHMDALGRLLVLGDDARAAAIVNARLRAAVDRKLGQA
ncbi:MAG TPA: response regulator [Caulobacteraceae bacterium]|nr:response regulator [Caulobacteraceae bacterium]